MKRPKPSYNSVKFAGSAGAKKVHQFYTDGAEGCIRWCNDFVCIPIYPVGETLSKWVLLGDLPDDKHPDTGRSYLDMWTAQQEVLRDALVMEGGVFKYNLLVFSWMRGEGKTFISILIQLWMFFNFDRQNIVLCANSKDQTKFVTYDQIVSVIEHSPKLIGILGKKNIQEKEIRLKDRDGSIVSRIRTVSSFSGVLSGTTAFSFTEAFEMKSPEFFNQLYGSLRNVPNGLGFIDTTVSTRDHFIYALYKAYVDGKNTKLFFSYRCSEHGEAKDYWHPHQTQDQLNAFRSTSIQGMFERYFMNTWDAGINAFFDPIQIEAMHVVGADGVLINHEVVMKNLKYIRRMKDLEGSFAKKGKHVSKANLIAKIESRLRRTDTVYSLCDHTNMPRMATAFDLETLSSMYDTDWGVIIGIDRAQPGKAATNARTILVAIAKGLMGSRGRYVDDVEAPPYIYFILHVEHIASSELDDIKNAIMRVNHEFGGVDTVGSEKWGMWDLQNFCSDNDIRLELLQPTYRAQREVFTEVYTLLNTGRLKCPPLKAMGQRSDDILVEEMLMFDHSHESHTRGFFGSPEKKKSRGVQDDAVFALGNGIWGARFLGYDEFRERSGSRDFGVFYHNDDLEGAYI